MIVVSYIYSTKIQIQMNLRTRVQVDGVVIGIFRRFVYYPACDLCAGKLTVLQENSKYLIQVFHITLKHSCISNVVRSGARIGVGDAVTRWKRRKYIIDIV